MKKVVIFILAVSLFAACKNDKNGKDDRINTKEKDDYRSDDKMDDNKDTKNTDFTKDDKKENTDDVNGNDDGGAGCQEATKVNSWMIVREPPRKMLVLPVQTNIVIVCFNE